jgi:hypothetical protein
MGEPCHIVSCGTQKFGMFLHMMEMLYMRIGLLVAEVRYREPSSQKNPSQQECCCAILAPHVANPFRRSKLVGPTP